MTNTDIRIESAWGTDNSIYPAAKSIRERVFGGEQHVPADRDFDGLDARCLHYVLSGNNTPAATLRILPLKDGTWQIERVATVRDLRGRGYGRSLMNRVITDAHNHRIPAFVLHSQVQAIGFYEHFGFTASGPQFTDAGIQHRLMRLDLRS